MLIKGTSTSDLREGPGIYPQTSFPGAAGTTAIAGHRTTFLAPFRHIDKLVRGDTVTVDMPYGRFIYSVIGHRVVKPTDVAVIDPVGYSRLVLSACTPLYSAAERLIVFARLVRIDPLGVARVSRGAGHGAATSGARSPSARGARRRTAARARRLRPAPFRPR